MQARAGPALLVNTWGSPRPLHVLGFGDWVAGQQQGANGGGDRCCGAGSGQGERGVPGELGELGGHRARGSLLSVEEIAARGLPQPLLCLVERPAAFSD